MSKLGYKPLGTRILVLQDAAAEKTATGIIIPDTAKILTEIAEVIEIGKEVDAVKVGDKISYREHAGRAIKLKGVDYLLMNQMDAEGIFDKEK
jgi:chaperonin GroES